MNSLWRRQRGQAIVEALLMLPLLALLSWAVSRIGGLQFTAQEMAQASRKAVMSAAHGQPLRDLGASARANLSGGSQLLADGAPARLASLQDAWFGTGLQLLSVEASAARINGQGSGLGSGQALPRIARYTRVASGAGYAHGDADVRRRIGQAPQSWRRAADGSLAQARRLDGLVSRLDGPWGRPRLSSDWLSAWTDVVPPDRLGSRGGRIK